MDNFLLPEGKWFATIAKTLHTKAERRRELDFKDSYRYRNIISDLEYDIIFCLDLLGDSESIPQELHPIIIQIIESSFRFGRWPSEIIKKSVSTIEKYK